MKLLAQSLIENFDRWDFNNSSRLKSLHLSFNHDMIVYIEEKLGADAFVEKLKKFLPADARIVRYNSTPFMDASDAEYGSGGRILQVISEDPDWQERSELDAVTLLELLGYQV